MADMHKYHWHIQYNPLKSTCLSSSVSILHRKTKKQGWMSLGGILLCITGSEAMFVDLGHFSYHAIQIAFTFLVYPAFILAYMGQVAYLSKNHQNVDHISYYVSVLGICLIIHDQNVNKKQFDPSLCYFRKLEVASACKSHSCFRRCWQRMLNRRLYALTSQEKKDYILKTCELKGNCDEMMDGSDYDDEDDDYEDEDEDDIVDLEDIAGKEPSKKDFGNDVVTSKGKKNAEKENGKSCG